MSDGAKLYPDGLNDKTKEIGGSAFESSGANRDDARHRSTKPTRR